MTSKKPTLSTFKPSSEMRIFVGFIKGEATIIAALSSNDPAKYIPEILDIRKDDADCRDGILTLHMLDRLGSDYGAPITRHSLAEEHNAITNSQANIEATWKLVQRLSLFHRTENMILHEVAKAQIYHDRNFTPSSP